MNSILNNPNNACELLEMTSGILLLLDEDGVCIDIKSTNQKKWYLQEDLFRGKNLLELMPPATLREFYPNFENALYNKVTSSQTYEMWMEGQNFFFSCTMQHYKGMVLCECWDTTKSSLEQKQLIKKNEVMTEILYISLIGTWMYNSELNVLRYTGHGGVMEHNGVIDLDLMTYSSYVVPEDRKDFNEWVLKNRNGKIGDTMKFRIRFNNKIYYMKARALNYERLDNGGFVIEGYAHNVTEIQKSRNDVNMLTLAIDNAMEYITAVDLNGNMIFANNMFRKSMNLGMQEDITKMKLWDLFITVDTPEAWQRIVKTTKEGNLEKGWIMLSPLKLHPEVLALDMNAFLVTDDAGMESIWFIGRDITDTVEAAKKLKKEKERAEQSERLKSVFLANMSHEIRTPLNAIVGFSRIISEVDDAENKAEICRIIEDNNEQLLHLINDLLDLSKIEANMVNYNIQPISMNELCQEIYRSFELRFQEGILFVNEAIGEDHFALADKSRVIQVFSNLIENALKFTKHGSIRIGYEVKGNLIEAYTTDTGIGIAEDKIGSIFDRFVKANEHVQGTGLGLSICKTLVEKMGGSIHVESKAGKGTTFRFTLPLAENVQ